MNSVTIGSQIYDRVINLAEEIQSIPAPTFGEKQRAEFIHDFFTKEEGLRDVSMDELGNVYGCFPGEGVHLPVIVSAHLDTVFPQDTPLRTRRESDLLFGPGIGDNSLGVAGLLGLLWLLKSVNGGRKLPGHVWLVANVGEEGLGNSRGMRKVVDRFNKNAVAYIVIEGMALGHIYHRALGVHRYRIELQTPGGHSWVDFGHPSAIHEIASLIARLTNLPLPSRPRTTLNVGTISGGTSVNTIAAAAALELDLRSEGTSALNYLVRQVKSCVRQKNQSSVHAHIEEIGHRPAGKISVSHPLVMLAKRCLESQNIKPTLAIGSTDANIPLSRKLPAVCVGLTKGGGAHTQNEFIDTRMLPQGLNHLVDFVRSVFYELPLYL